MRPPSHTRPARPLPTTAAGLCRYTSTTARQPASLAPPKAWTAARAAAWATPPPRCPTWRAGAISPAAAVPGPAAGIALGGGAWAVTLLPAEMQAQARHLVLGLAGPDGPSAAAGGDVCTVARIPAARVDPRLGPAVLHHAGGQTVIYCADDQIKQPAADLLGAFVSQTADLLGRCGAAGAGPAVQVMRLGHGEFGALHPAVAVARNGQLTAYLCARQITAALADTLGALWQGLRALPGTPPARHSEQR